MSTATLQSLQSDVQKLQSQVAALSSITKSHTNTVNPSARGKVQAGSVAGDQILDLTWNRFFYYYTPFESLDGWDAAGTGTSSVGDGGITLTTGTSSNNAVSIDKAPLNDSTLSFDKDSRFRTTATITNTTNTQDLLTIGDPQVGAGKAYYGFAMVNGVLYGICGNGVSTSSVMLENVVGPQVVQMEARLIARTRVDFYATTSSTSTQPVLLGSLTTTLPTGKVIANGAFWFFVQCETLNASAKQLSINSLEYIQLR